LIRCARRTERAAVDADADAGPGHQIRVLIVKEGDKYRSMAKHMREQADTTADRSIRDQFVKIAKRYEELAEQVEAASRRAD
jgi:hypothetical protein